MESEVKKAAIYARVSSERQDVDLSISAQLKALREYAARQNYPIVKEYVDEAESGRSIDRPGFKAMIAVSRQKPAPFQVILVWKLSRFARNREDSIIYKSLLRKHGVQLVSINEPLEDTPSGRLLEGIIEVIDEFYSANLSQDVVRGMRESASRGFYPGGPIPYGYSRVKIQDGATSRSKLEPNSATSPVVERIFRECVSGQGMVEIVKGLNGDGLTTRAGNKWGKTSVHNILRNEAYAGVLTWDMRRRRHNGGGDPPVPIRIEDAWPPIVGKETFEQAQAMLKSRAPKVTHPRVVHSEYVLSGMIKCKECGTAMIGHAVKSGKFFYYMCGNARRRGREVCQTPLLPKERMERFIIDRIRECIITEENLEGLVKFTNEELAQECGEGKEKLELLDVQIAEVDSRLGKLYDALETGEYKKGALAPRIHALFQKKEDLQRARVEAEDALRFRTIELADRRVIGKYVSDFKALLDSPSITERKAFLKSFVERIEVGDSKAKVVYTFPMLPNGESSEMVGVLPFVQNGPPSICRSRTEVHHKFAGSFELFGRLLPSRSNHQVAQDLMVRASPTSGRFRV